MYCSMYIVVYFSKWIIYIFGEKHNIAFVALCVCVWAKYLGNHSGRFNSQSGHFGFVVSLSKNLLSLYTQLNGDLVLT